MSLDSTLRPLVTLVYLVSYKVDDSTRPRLFCLVITKKLTNNRLSQYFLLQYLIAKILTYTKPGPRRQSATRDNIESIIVP